MGFYEYMLLTEEQQWNELWQNGDFITHYISKTQKYSLYALHKFYVQVELSQETDKIIGKVEFKHGHQMEKYAGSIDINKL